MKRILLLLSFSLFFILSAFAQKYSFSGLSNTSNEPKPQATPTVVSCGTLTLSISGTDPLCNGAASGTATVVATGGTGPYTYKWTPSNQSTPVATGLVGNTYIIQVWDNTALLCSGPIALINPTSLIIDITPPAPVSSCFGFCDGSATASPTGGTAPFTYSWNTTPPQSTAQATGLCALTYTITMTDGNGCSNSTSVNIGQPALLVSNGSSTTINCSGNCNGTATVAPSGGNPPYTYSWTGGATTPSISALCIGDYTCGITDKKGCFTSYSTAITSPGSLTVTVSGTDLLCNGICTGSANAIVTGGVTPYTYSWTSGGTSSTATGLCANTFSVTVTDFNGCALTRSVTISQPSAIVVAPTGTDLSCFNQCDGTADANASGGTAPYTYSWSPSGCTTSACSNLCNGTYTVTVSDAVGCVISGTVTLSQPALLTVAPGKSDVTCFGSCNGSVTATPSGGTAPYTYSWLPGGCTTSACAGLCVGDYTITVTDSQSCIATSTINITSPLALVTNCSSTPALCFGTCDGIVSAAPTGGTAPYTYSWSSGCVTSSCSNLCAGNYTLSLTDANGCASSGTVSVSQPNIFTASVSSAVPNPLNCNGDCNGTALATLNGGTPTYSYLWQNGATIASATGLCAGTHTLIATDANGCPATASVTFLEPTPLTIGITTFNPTCGGGCNGVISAIPGGGTPGYSYSWMPGGQTTSSIAGLCAGDYTLTLTDSKNCSAIQIVTLTAPAILSANVSILNNVSCSGVCDGSAISNPTGGTSPFTYLWTGGITTQTITGLCAGVKSVTVLDANGCPDVDFFTITQPSVLSSIISSSTSSCGACSGSASITTSGGTAPYTYLWSPGGQSTSSSTGLCSGNYSITITDSNGCINTLTTTISSAISSAISVSGPGVTCSGSCDGTANASPIGGLAPFTYQWNSTPAQSTQSATGLCAGSYTVTLTDFTGCVTTNTVTFSSPAILTTTLSSTSASCGLCNGTTTVASSGGTAAYTYSWSGFPSQTTATATGLCQGNYSVTVTDANNCIATNTVAVGNVPTISDNATTTLASCGGTNGEICVAPTGGTPGYTYLWSPSGSTVSCLNGLAAGIYTVTISDLAGCSVDFPIALGSVNGPTLTVTSSSDPNCNAGCDGDIAVSAAGNFPFTYLWNPGGQTTTSISALCAGTYIVQVNDNVPCTSFSSTTLTSPPQIIANPAITHVSCTGGTNGNICLSPGGGASPYTFTWSSGQSTSCITGLTAGTYTVILADANGCDDTLLIPVTEPALLNVAISSTTVSCNGSGNGTATAIVSGGTSPYTYAWSTGSALPGIAGLSPGNYSVNVTDTKGCIGTATVTISQPAVLSTTVTSSNISCNSLCDGIGTLTASGGTSAYSYSWIPGGETTSSITGLCSGNYMGTITDANGCASSQTFSITQPAAISATVSTTNTSCIIGCDGAASANVGGGTGFYTYAWTPGGLTTSSVTGLCSGSYTLITTDANGCTSTNLFSVSSPSVLQANISTTVVSCISTCDGTATSSPVGGTGAYTYQWSNGQTTATATGLCAGTHTLTLSDANGCMISQTTTIINPPAITQASSVTDATCLVCNGSITVIASGGTSPYSYLWSTGATTATVTGLCAGVYIDTVIDAKGCIFIDTISISNINGPVITTSSTNVTCFGACNGTAAVTSAIGNGPPWVYAWTFVPGSQTTQSVSGLCPNQYFAHVTDVNGCTTINAVNITQPAQLAPNMTVTNASCFGICDGSITTSATGGTGAYTYSWLPGGATTTSIVAQCAGNYTLTLLDANNCSITTTITIGQNAILTSTISSTNNSCNASCNGTASITLSGGTVPYTYAWTGGQTTSATTGFCANNYTVSVSDALGCIHTNTVAITEPAVLLSNTTATNPLCNATCNGSISSVPTGGTAPYTYTWMPGNLTTSAITGLCSGTYTLTLVDANNCNATNTFTLTEPAAITSTSVIINANCTNSCDGSINMTPAGGTAPYTFLWTPGAQTTEDVTGLCTGNYTLTITDSNTCSATYTMSIGATTSILAVAGNDTAFCLGGSATLCGTLSQNGTSFNWFELPLWTLKDTDTCTIVSPLVTTDYGLIVANGSCSDTDFVTVTIYPGPAVNAGSNATIQSFASTILNGSGNGTYLWSPATGLSSTTDANPTASPTLSTTYTLLVTDINGCTSTDTVTITVITVVVPNDGLSPNGDGINDFWIIPNIEQFPNALVEVYNRWGEVLFSTVDYKNNLWDATYKGKQLPVGTYYYVINLNSDLSPDPITGPITILR